MWKLCQDRHHVEQRYLGRMQKQLDEEFTALTAILTEYEIPAAATQ